ncbi:MAG: RNA-binding cell elongation regulator Jag/EloR [Desulfobacteraceae bacterium]|jgi:spoIIIJ-associated protein
MTQFLEFEGKSMDKALEKASNDLNTPVEDLEYDVVSYGSSGIFGLVGAKKAKIRIKKKNNGLDVSTTVSKARDIVKDAFDIKDETPSPRQVRPAGKNKAPAKEKAEKKEITPENIESAIRIGKEALQRIADFITTDATIETEISDQRIIFKVEGGNSGMLIGKRGQTLEAMQYLVEKIVNKQNQQRVRILVDVEGYLETRKDNLQQMAARMADKATKSKKPVTIGQMNAYDRRTVHMYLKSNSAVRTQSVGEGYYRKLIIFPKKRQRRRSNRSSS